VVQRDYRRRNSICCVPTTFPANQLADEVPSTPAPTFMRVLDIIAHWHFFAVLSPGRWSMGPQCQAGATDRGKVGIPRRRRSQARVDGVDGELAAVGYGCHIPCARRRLLG
jgi:hypothetical protein